MRFAIAAAALALGTQGELLHDRFHRMAAVQGRSNERPSNATSTTPAVPGPSNSTIPLPPRNSTGCMDLSHLVADDWEAAGTSAWLDKWWQTNAAAISQNGFLSTFGSLVLNDPSWTCAIDGTCIVPCVPIQEASAQGNLQARQIAANHNTDTQSNNGQASGNVANSLSNLQTQFNSLYTILNSAGTKTSLDIDSIVQNFWYQGGADSQMEVMQGLRAFAMIVAIAASFVPGGGAMAAAAGSAIVGGSITLGLGSMPGAGEPRWVKAGEVGHEISNFITDAEQGLQQLYNDITAGKLIGDSNSDLRTVLTNGTYLSSHMADMSATMTSAMKSTVINYLWRQSKVFILGGASCNEDQGIGQTGSKDGYEMIWWCDDENNAWYLYNFSDEAAANEKHPRVDRPWGADRMGENSYLSTHGGSPPYWPDINPWNVVISSVKSFRVAGNNYTTETWHSRVLDMFRTGANPWFEGNAMEGLWTIPVCNIAQTVNSDFKGKENILKPYGWDSRAMWCGNICDNNEATTNAFFESANLGKNPFAESC